MASTLIVIGISLIVVGFALVLVGDRMRRKGGGRTAAVPDKFWTWFLSVVKKAFKTIGDKDAGPGEKIAAFGTLLMGAGVMALVVGLFVALGGPKDPTKTTTPVTSAS